MLCANHGLPWMNLSRLLAFPSSYFSAQARLYSRNYCKRNLLRIPRRNNAKDEKRIERVKEVLKLESHAVTIKYDDEFLKCLYPLRNCKVNFPQGSSYEVGQLEQLGDSVLRLALNMSLLNVFKKTNQDICGLDFNFDGKMKHLSSSKKSPRLLIRSFVNQKFDKLARITAPENTVPARIRRIFDYRSFNAIIGYIMLTNERQPVLNVVEEAVSKPILRKVFDY